MKPVAQILVRVYEDGALSVEGDIGDAAWCCAALENARDAVRNNALRRAGALVVPSKDVDVPNPLHPLVSA